MNISVLDIKTLGDDLSFESVQSLGEVKFYDLKWHNWGPFWGSSS